jgi:NaMN:DMB phosphoribosyltransferase
MDERERRVGENEALFREVNERLRNVNESFGALTDRIELVCECGDPACAKRITLSTAEYKRLRANGDQFVLVAGHADHSDVEDVVAHGAGWEIVRKRPGEPAALAEQTDPRS